MDILVSIDRVLEYAKNLDFGSSRSHIKTLDSVLRNFGVIGEEES